METAPLKSFATWARTTLIREVTARVGVVLAPGSPERVEQPKAVTDLEAAVNAAGGGERGRAAVADRVAYTWFNRIIALRFMDANRYTGIGVVSPQAGVESGQPEILAEAKRGNVDSAIVGAKARELVTGLLNGTRRSGDPEGEAFPLLLTEFCRHWNRAMPFMFEREGDYTELLIPPNLLADDSVLSRAAKILTTDACRDVEVIGWIYQFYIEERHDEVLAGFKKNKKAGAPEIPAATQLFTPHWIVRYLVENSLGRLWMLNRPSSRLVDQMEYYIAPADEETDFLKVSSPHELKVIDPACGSGHLLTYAFDLLYAIYEEEGYAPTEIPGLILANNLYGVEIDPRSGALAAFALTMKARSRQRTFFNKQVQANVRVLEPISFTPQELDLLVTTTGDRTAEEAFWNQFKDADAYGSLIRPSEELTGYLGSQLAENVNDGDDLFAQDVIKRARQVMVQAEMLLPRYSVVVANPPYMGSGNMSPALSTWVKENYAAQKQDLYACFVARACELSRLDAPIAMIVGDTWMTIRSFEKFRLGLLQDFTFWSFVHLHDISNHPDIFGANAAFVLQNRSSHGHVCTFVSLEPLSGDAKSGRLLAAIGDATLPWVFRIATDEFGEIPGTPFVYEMASTLAPAFKSGSALSKVAYTRIGLITGDNDSYIREWWEVSVHHIGQNLSRGEAAVSGLRWFPISKGGGYRKWFGNATAVIDWQYDGKRLQTRLDPTGSRILAHNFNLDDIFKEGVTWSKVSSGRFSGRLHSYGYIFNDPSANLFPADSSVPVVLLLAYLSSNIADILLRGLNPTLNYQPGNVSTLPWPDVLETATVAAVGHEALSIAQDDWDAAEISLGFRSSSLIQPQIANRLIAESLQELLDRYATRAQRLAELEHQNNIAFINSMGLAGVVDPTISIDEITLETNPDWVYRNVADPSNRRALLACRLVSELVSYAVGCMFGRYAIDTPGLILADQGATLQDYLAKQPDPAFSPDEDNVIPIVDGDWFEDDIVARFRKFLRVAFGEEHFEENLRFITESLGVKDLRDYFVKSFYTDHVKRYKKRPIYWLFSSPKGSFNALIYLHRYTPSTVSTVLNEYLREYTAKLRASLEQRERLAAGGGSPREQAAALKEAERLRKVLTELEEYEHDVLYPLASQQLAIDLDDGVKANYPKFGAALKKIPGLEASDE